MEIKTLVVVVVTEVVTEIVTDTTVSDVDWYQILLLCFH